MSSAVEDRILAMKFDNKQFDPNVKSSMSILDKLKSALNLKGAGKGLGELQNAASRFSLGGLTSGVGQVGAKFNAMSVVAIAALANIVGKAVDSGIRIAKALSLDPLKQGFQEYEANLGATQTIMSGTGEDVNKVTASLQRLNAYSDKTIYSFSDMTKNISMFTNAGLSSSKATDVMIGISNAAAAAGISADKAANAMFGFGQSMSVGHVQLQDWNQIDQAGIATKEFKEQLIAAGLASGTLKKANDGTIKTNKGTEVTFKNLRNTLQDQWLTSDVLTNTLNKYSNAQTDVGKKAAKNAQNVYKFTQLMDVTKESIGSGWSQSFQEIFGNLKEASGLFSSVNAALNGPNGFISTNSAARNAVLKTWKDLGGRKAVLEGFRYTFEAIVAVLKPIREAFRSIFPAVTGKQLAILSVKFLDFASHLKIGAETASKIKRSFAGLFAIFHIGAQLVRAIFVAFGDLFGVLKGSGGGFLDMTAKIGDWLVALDKAISNGNVFVTFLRKMERALKNPVALFEKLTGAVKNFFKSLIGNPVDTLQKGLSNLAKWLKPIGGIADVAGSAFERLAKRLEPLAHVAKIVGRGFEGVVKFMIKAGKAMAPLMEVMGAAFSKLGDVIAKAIKTGDFSTAFDALNTGLLGGLVLVIKHFLDKGINIDFGGGLVKSIKDTFGALTDTLGALQNNIKAKTLFAIAAAVALLVASIVVLSLIDSKALTKALTAITVAFAQLLGAMAILDKISGSMGLLKMPFIAASMILFAGAILILSFAVRSLSGLSWEELAKGLSGVVGLIAGVALALKLMPKSMPATSLQLLALAVAIRILASAVKAFGEMSWGDMVKGIIGMTASIAGIGLALRLMPKNMPATSLQLLALAVSVRILASALKSFGDMSWGEIVKGLFAMVGSLAALVGALRAMPKDMAGKAASLLILSAAMKVMASALQDLGGMTWGEIVKGILALAGAMTIMVVALNLMKGTAAGSAALALAAVALGMLVPVIIILGSLPLKTLAIGLGAIAAVFVILGVAGLVLAEVAPIIALLAASIFLLGAAVALTGAGLLAMATAFSIFVAAASLGGTALLTLINLIPAMMTRFAQGITAFVVSLAAGSGDIIKAGVKLIINFLKGISQVLPQLYKTVGDLIITMCKIVIENAPRLMAAGAKLLIQFMLAIYNNLDKIVNLGAAIIVKFLNGIARNIDKIVKAGTNLIVKFMDAITKQQKTLLDKGAKMIIAFVNNLAKTIRKNEKGMRDAGRNLASAIIHGMTGGLSDLAHLVADAAWDMAMSAWNAAKRALGIRSPSRAFRYLGQMSGEGAAVGFDKSTGVVVQSAKSMALKALSASEKAMQGFKTAMPSLMPEDPTIKPTLDLSNITSGASKMNSLLGGSSISAELSAAKAQSLAALMQPMTAPDDVSSKPAPAPVEIKLEQNNYSPKALSEGEIYMDTKSLLGQLKGAIGDIRQR